MTDEEKQIEEIEKMAYSICAMGTVSEYIIDCDKCGYYNDCLRLAFAKRFYEAGYRKQSETARDIIKDILWTVENCTKGYLREHLRELAEKYGIKQEDTKCD